MPRSDHHPRRVAPRLHRLAHRPVAHEREGRAGGPGRDEEVKPLLRAPPSRRTPSSGGPGGPR
jgi:hypothetical protein